MLLAVSLPSARLAPCTGDRAELERLARSTGPRLAERARIVLACAESADGDSGVAAELGLSKPVLTGVEREKIRRGARNSV